MKAEWIDVTAPLDTSVLPPWPGDMPYERKVQSRAGVEGAECTLSSLSGSAHYGTHVDGYNHFIPGAPGVDGLPLDLMIGPAYLLDVRGRSEIGEQDVKGCLPQGVQRVLFRTDNERILLSGQFHPEYCALTPSAAGYLLDYGVRLFGIDYHSIAAQWANREVHVMLLASRNTVVLETLNLNGLEAGWYDLICLPLKVICGDGAPARVLMRRKENGKETES